MKAVSAAPSLETQIGWEARKETRRESGGGRDESLGSSYFFHAWGLAVRQSEGKRER
jgi:hypothetical protein